MFKGFPTQKSNMSHEEEEREGNEVHLDLPCGRQNVKIGARSELQCKVLLSVGGNRARMGCFGEEDALLGGFAVTSRLYCIKQ